MPLKILSRRIQQNAADVNAEKKMLHDYQAKMLKEILPHLF